MGRCLGHERFEVNVTIPKKDLIPFIERAGGVADPKSAIPALSNVLLRAKDRRLEVAATDLYMLFTAGSEAAVEEPGEIALPAKDLFERVKHLPDGPIQITTSEQAATIKVVGQKRQYTMQGLSGQDYPTLPEPKDVAWNRMPSGTLRMLLKRVRDAISTDETRAHVNSALLVGDGNMLTAVATDGHRLHMARVSNAARLGSILVPLKAVAELQRLLDKASDDIEIGVSGPHLFVRFGPILWGCKLVDATFPPYQQVVPAPSPVFATVRRQGLIDAAKAIAVSAATKTGGVEIVLAPDVLRVKASSPETGSAEDEMPIAYTGPEVRLGMNAAYLVQALSVLDAEDVRLSTSGELDPLVVTLDDDRDFVAVTMPLRL